MPRHNSPGIALSPLNAMPSPSDIAVVRPATAARPDVPQAIGSAELRLEGLRNRRQLRDGGLVDGEHLHVARELSAALDLDLAVAHRADDLTRAADEQPLADRQRALEAAADLRVLDRGRALEEA